MLRTIITPDSTNIQVAIPKNYVGKQVEITCLALEEIEPGPAKKTMADFWGVISNETAEILLSEIKKSR